MLFVYDSATESKYLSIFSWKTIVRIYSSCYSKQKRLL